MLSTTALARTSRSIKRLAFGCEQLGGYQWGSLDVAAIEESIELALNEGVVFFDTADCYGRGVSEERLGRVLSAHRDSVVVATKFGVRFANDGQVYYDSSPQWAEHALHASLRRLNMAHVDLFQVHYWDGKTPIDATFERLEALRSSGKISAYGVTNFIPDLGTVSQYPGLSTVSLELSLANRSNEQAARSIAGHGLSFVSYGSLGQGVLTGKYLAQHQFEHDDRRARDAYVNFHGAKYARNLQIVAQLRRYADELSASIPQLALAWILHRIAHSIALVGVKRPSQLKDVCGALQLSIPEDILQALDRCSADSNPIDESEE